MDIHALANEVNQYSDEIVKNLKEESIEVYCFLNEQFEKTNVIDNKLFQFVFRSFYRLDNAGLSEVEENRNNPSTLPSAIAQQLNHHLRLKGDKSYQFSFATKLVNMINSNFPIYDSEVARAFQFSSYYLSDIDKKVKRFESYQNQINYSYDLILQKNLLQTTLKKFDDKFNGYVIEDIKKLDFIFWSYGKLLSRKKDLSTSETERTREFVRTKLLRAKEAGLQEIELISRNIHKEMGYINRFPTVCDAMKSLGLFRMEVIQSPPKGRGANLRIRYYLGESGKISEDVIEVI